MNFSVPTLNNKTNGCRFKFNAVILKKLSIQHIVNCGRVLVLFLEKLENAARFETDFVLDLTMRFSDMDPQSSKCYAKFLEG